MTTIDVSPSERVLGLVARLIAPMLPTMFRAEIAKLERVARERQTAAER